MSMAGGDTDPPDLSVKAVGTPRPATGAAATAATTATAVVEGADPTLASQPISAAGSSASISSSDGVAAALSTGAIDAEQAKARLIEEAVAAALPANADPATVAALRLEIAELLASDPVLGDLLRA